MIPTEIEVYLQFIRELQFVSNCIFFILGVAVGFLINILFDFISFKLSQYRKKSIRGDPDDSSM